MIVIAWSDMRLRSTDGLTLYAVSSDGTMAVFSFDSAEMEGIAPQSAQEQYLKRFGFAMPPLPDGYSHQHAATQSKPQQATHITPPPSPRAQSQDFGSAANAAAGGEQVHTLVAKRKPKKRLQPTFAGSIANSIPSSSVNGINSIPSSRPPGSSAVRGYQDIPMSSTIPISVPSTSALPLSVSQPFGSSSSAFGLGLNTGEDFSMEVDGEVRISSLDSASHNGRGKRRAGEDFDDRMTGKPRTLGGDRVRETVPVRPITNRPPPATLVSGAGLFAEGSGLAGRLEPPPVVTYLKATVEGSEDLFEGRNSESDGTFEMTVCVSVRQVLTSDGGCVQNRMRYCMLVGSRRSGWTTYLRRLLRSLRRLPSARLGCKTAHLLCTRIQVEGEGRLDVVKVTMLNSPSRLMPALSIGSQCYALASARNMLMLLTVSGQLYVWSVNYLCMRYLALTRTFRDVKKQAARFPPTSVSPIMGSSPNLTIFSAVVRPNGAPVIQLSDGVAHSYDASLCVWTKLSEPWWAEGSDAWQGRQRSNNQSARGPLTVLEGAISERLSLDDGRAEKVRPAWWNTALTLGHLESKLHAAKALESPQEYKQALLLYAKRIADEGFRGKAEELVKEMFGPVYWCVDDAFGYACDEDEEPDVICDDGRRPGRDDAWSPTVTGLPKRDLLKEVLNIFGT